LEFLIFWYIIQECVRSVWFQILKLEDDLRAEESKAGKEMQQMSVEPGGFLLGIYVST